MGSLVVRKILTLDRKILKFNLLAKSTNENCPNESKARKLATKVERAGLGRRRCNIKLGLSLNAVMK